MRAPVEFQRALWPQNLALDRQLYLRLLIQSLLHGEPQYGPARPYHVKIPRIMVAGASRCTAA